MKIKPLPSFWSLSCGRKSNCHTFPTASGDTRPEAVRYWNIRVEREVSQIPITAATETPFVARCGSVLIFVDALDGSFAEGFIILRGVLLEGKHFNDIGDYGVGDRVNIGPITDSWRRISLVN